MIPGALESMKEIELPVGEQLFVPKCKEWSLVDTYKFDGNNFLKISGDIEIRSEGNHSSRAKSYISGRFVYTAKGGQPDQSIHIISGSELFFFSKENTKVVRVNEWKVTPDASGKCRLSSHNKLL